MLIILPMDNLWTTSLLPYKLPTGRATKLKERRAMNNLLKSDSPV